MKRGETARVEKLQISIVKEKGRRRKINGIILM